MARDISEYERSLIGGLICSPSRNVPRAIDAGTRAAWFSVDAWSLAWSAIEAAWKRGEIDGLTPITMLAEARRIAAAPKDQRSAEALTSLAISDAIAAAPVDITPTLTLLRNVDIERRARAAVAESFKTFEEYADATDVVIDTRMRLDAVLTRVASAKKFRRARSWTKSWPSTARRIRCASRKTARATSDGSRAIKCRGRK